MTTAAALSPQIVTGSARASSRAEMDAAVATLQASKGAWTAVSVRERREILGELSRRFLAVADPWANLGIEAEGLDPEHPRSGEGAPGGAYFILRHPRPLRGALPDRGNPRRPPLPAGGRPPP